MKGKIAQIPAFFENVIPWPVGSLMPSGSRTLKRVKCRIQTSVNFNFLSSINFFLFQDSIFLILCILEQHLIGLKKINSQAAQNWSKSVPMVFLWQLLRWFLVTSIPDKLHFLHPPAAFNLKKLLVSSTIFFVFTSSIKKYSFDSSI